MNDEMERKGGGLGQKKVKERGIERKSESIDRRRSENYRLFFFF